MNKTYFAFFFLLSVFGELSAQQSEKLITGNTNAVALAVDSLQAVSSTPSSSCYGVDFTQTRKRVPVDTSLRQANLNNEEPEQMRKRVPVDTSQRQANLNNEESEQMRKRVPVDTSLRLASSQAGNGTFEEMRKRVPVDTSQRVGTFDASIAVFPNPASGTLYLRQLPEQTAVRLYSSAGQLIRDERATGNSLDIDLSALPEGIYVLQLPELNKVVRIVHTF